MNAVTRWIERRAREWSFVISPPPPADPPGTEPPIRMDPDSAMSGAGSVPVVSFRGIVKHSMTKKSRLDLSQRMVEMCTLSGWQSTTLNPDMGTEAKMAILSDRFGHIATENDDESLYQALIALSAVSMGWAQGIERRNARDRKRLSRERKRARREAKRRAKRERKGAGDEAKDKDG